MQFIEKDFSDFILKICAGLLFLIVAYELFSGTTQVISGIHTQSWNRVDGTILESKAIQAQSLAYGRSGGIGIRPNYPKIQYRYYVGKKMYKGDRVQFGQVFNQPSIERIFPVNKVVPVFVKPGDPEHAVLKQGVHWMGTLYTIAVALFFSCLGCVVWFYRWY